MDLVELTRRLERDVYDGSQRAALQRLGRAMGRARGLRRLAESNDNSLEPFPAESLLKLADVHRAHQKWVATAVEVRRALTAAGLGLPDGSFDFGTKPDELRALERIARMCPRSGFADHGGWYQAVRAHVELWRSLIDLSLEEGAVRVELDDAEHPEAEELSAHVSSRTALSELPGHRWLGLRRGQRAGALAVELELEPLRDSHLELCEARLADLGPLAEKRGAASVFEELAGDHLESTVLSRLDARAEREAIATARAAYVGLLSTPPLEEDPVLAIHVGSSGAPLGIALVARNGELLDSASCPPEQDAAAAVREALERHEVPVAVLPASSPDLERLRLVESALGEIPSERISPAALREARGKQSLPPEIGSAVVLARRALRPSREWGRIEPASLGLGEYSRDLDPELLSEMLHEARQVTSWDRHRRRKSPPAPQGAAGPRRRTPLNPLVKSIRDLKPGMSVDGVVTNLTRFGAFVNIGLSTEAMIHVSQLADEFVEEPAQVVRVGQRVKAMVIEVVPEKSRIALSLKQQEGQATGGGAPIARGDRGRAEREWSSARQGGPRSGKNGKGRNAALADLDALFKK
ncbi:MAG: S1 RNA-binding domain-containing protein [Polyangia bacterium]